MEKIKKLRLCDLLLMPITILVLLSSIQMEVCGGEGLFGLPFSFWMYLHCILGTLMFVLVVEHLYLHLGKSKWLTKVKRLKRLTKWLCAIFAILLVISVVVFVRIIVLTTHSPIGAVHGKIGFLFLILCIWHTAKRWEWVKTQIFKSKK